MSKLLVEQEQRLEMRPEQRQILRIEQANLLEMPETEFQELISDTEQSPLFEMLQKKEKLIHYQRPAGTDISSSFYRLEEQTTADDTYPEVESLLQNKEPLLRRIQKLGRDNFRQYFLLPESSMTVEEIASVCELEPVEVHQINELINDFAVISEFSRSTCDDSGSLHYSKIASVERNRDGLVLGYFSPALARGRYVIDYAGFEELKLSGVLGETELKEAKQLFKKLELINSRKATLSRILNDIISQQHDYLESGDARSLRSLTQKQLASRIGVAASSVSRAISGKSVETPWHQELPLKHFFPRPRRFKREMLKRVLAGGKLTSDDAIRVKLWESCGIAVSRRLVGDLRRELKIDAGHGRTMAV